MGTIKRLNTFFVVSITSVVDSVVFRSYVKPSDIRQSDRKIDLNRLYPTQKKTKTKNKFSIHALRYTCDCQLKHLIYFTNTYTNIQTRWLEFFCCFVSVVAAAVGILHFFFVVVVGAIVDVEHDKRIY